MDKEYQDLHIRNTKLRKETDLDLFALRQIEILEMYKRPSYFLIRYRQPPYIREYEIIIPILPFMSITID